MAWLGLDIGGANLKLADAAGLARSRFFPLWKEPKKLASALARLLRTAPLPDGIAVSMTGELADCFRSKRQGVKAIVQATQRAVERCYLGRKMPVLFYGADGGWRTGEEAIANPLVVAAANWHALAQFAENRAGSRPALLVDIGSTTTDIIPLVNGRPAAQGATDPERLLSGELVYTGVVRSPVCALAASFPWRGQKCATAQELFATTVDAYVTLGDLPESRKAATADGRAATRKLCLERLARQICADAETFDEQDARAAAETIRDAQLARLALACQAVIRRMPQPPTKIILSGQGEFLGRQLVSRLRPPLPIESLGEQLGGPTSQVATAHALAVLADEQLASRIARQVKRRVIKVGGSLIGEPWLAERLRQLFERWPQDELVLIFGGGPEVDKLREERGPHQKETAHWESIAIMHCNTEEGAKLLGGLPFFESIDEFTEPEAGRRICFGVSRFMVNEDDLLPGKSLPIGWEVTSDSIAARVAELLHAELVLVKSTLPPEGMLTTAAVSAAGYVDESFPRSAVKLRPVHCIDLRSDPPRDAWLK